MSKLLHSELLASGHSSGFYSFVKSLADCTSKAEEHGRVDAELKRLSDRMGHPDISSARMKDYMIRLIHVFMLGYDVSFGTIYAIMATQSGETALDRRVGYIAATLFLQKNHDLTIMLVNTLQRDLASQNHLDRCAALTSICYLDHAEMQDAVLEKVLQCMEYPKQIVRKKAAIALLCLYQRTPDLLPQLEPYFRQALLDKDHSVVFAALSIWKYIVSIVPDPGKYEDLVPVITHILNDTMEGRNYQRSFIYHGVPAPWAQVACLQILGTFLKHGVGSQQDIYKVVVVCLTQAEHQVDAAYAIILECIHVFNTIDALLLENLMEAEELSPFRVLDRFLDSGNHTLRYLGLSGLERIDLNLWSDDWLDGRQLSKILETSQTDMTIIYKTLAILDKLLVFKKNTHARLQYMQAMGASIQKAVANTQAEKAVHERLSRWYLDRVISFGNTAFHWQAQTVIHVLAHSCKGLLEESYVDRTCERVKDVLDDADAAASIVDIFYDYLKRKQADVFYAAWMELAFSALGEYGYRSGTYSEQDIMQQLQKWIVLVDDDFLQLQGLEALKRCIQRSQTVLSGLRHMLTSFRRSPILEKQMAARELLKMLDDHDVRVFAEDEASLESLSLTENPNRPTGIHRFQTSSSPRPLGPLSIVHKPAQKMTTEKFGELWLAYTAEKSMERRAGHETFWALLDVVDNIGQETIAASENGGVLVHADAKTLTIRAASASALAHFVSQYL